MPITFHPSPKVKPEKVPFYERKESSTLIAQNTLPKNFIQSNHGFVDAVRQAYSTHHNLIIRPDDVWIAIATQFAMFVEKNGEELRDKFVNHSGKKELVVKEVSSLYTADYESLSMKMSQQIAENIKDPKVREWIIPNFSTTTNTDRVVGAMVLMASMKIYFDYKFQLCCGLPSVTMLGTEADWVDVANRAKKLIDYDNKEGYMKTWYKLLEPVLNNFVSSIRGKPNLEWWNRCCTFLTGGSGPRYLSGWLNVFSVYDNNGKWVANRREIQDTWSPKIIKSEWPIIESNDLANGTVDVNVTVDDNGTVYKTILTAGSSGYTRVDDFTIQPCLTWNISKV
jgi:hypothetical protein